MTFTTTSPSDFQLRVKHFANMADRLAHRLEVAKACHNAELVEQLQREYAQLMVERQAEQLQLSHRDQQAGAMAKWFQRLWNHFADTVPGLYQLQIEKSVDAQGQAVWQVYYPKTGQRMSTSSATELQSWIRQNYWQVSK